MAEEKKGGSKKKLFMIIGLVAVVAGVGFGGFMLGGGGKKAAAAKEAESVNSEIAADAAGGHGGHEEKKEEPKASAHGGGHGGGGHGGGHGAAKEEEPAKLSKKDITYKFQDVQVNLFDPKARTYISTSIMIEATSQEAYKQIEENEYPLRDATITLLSSKTKDEINPPEGRERLKRELLARYEGRVGQKVIAEIYLVDFKIITQ